jgi:hypothetical protein
LLHKLPGIGGDLSNANPQSATGTSSRLNLLAISGTRVIWLVTVLGLCQEKGLQRREKKNVKIHKDIIAQ